MLWKYETLSSSAFFVDSLRQRTRPLHGPTSKLTCVVDDSSGRQSNGPVAFRVAAHLSERHSVKLGTRSLDILHIVSAKAIRAAELLSFDVRQRSLAQLVGLVVAP